MLWLRLSTGLLADQSARGRWPACRSRQRYPARPGAQPTRAPGACTCASQLQLALLQHECGVNAVQTQGKSMAALMDQMSLAQQQEEASRRDAPKGHYDFWETQPVPQFNQQQAQVRLGLDRALQY